MSSTDAEPFGVSGGQIPDQAGMRSALSAGQIEFLANSTASASGNSGILGTSGKGPNTRGTLAVEIAAKQLESEGFVVLRREVVAWIPDTTLTRRYDLLAQNPQTKVVFGVGVKSSVRDQFKLDPKQVAFDVMTIKSGAMTELGIPIRSLMYRGVSFTTNPGAVWSTTTLIGALKAAGVGFNYTKAPLPF